MDQQRIASNAYFCMGMKDKQYTSTGTQYVIAKMRPVFPDGLGEPVNMTLFDANRLTDRSYKGKYFIFSRVTNPEKGNPTVNLKKYYRVVDDISKIPEDDVNSDHEYH